MKKNTLRPDITDKCLCIFASAIQSIVYTETELKISNL